MSTIYFPDYNISCVIFFQKMSYVMASYKALRILKLLSGRFASRNTCKVAQWEVIIFCNFSVVDRQIRCEVVGILSCFLELCIMVLE